MRATDRAGVFSPNWRAHDQANPKSGTPISTAATAAVVYLVGEPRCRRASYREHPPCRHRRFRGRSTADPTLSTHESQLYHHAAVAIRGTQRLVGGGFAAVAVCPTHSTHTQRA